jgi:hypothetical protein
MRAVRAEPTCRLQARTAKLADAQLALAREYGFENWPKLVAHVDAANPSGLKD